MAKWVMFYRRIREDGNGTCEHMVTDAKNFEDATEKVEEFCEMQNCKHPKEQYKPWPEAGYQLVIGGGCRW